MTEVKEEIIRNAEVRERLFNIPTIQNQIATRQLTFIGKVVRNLDQQLPTKLLTAWCNHKLRRGGVLHSNKKSIVQNIALILPCIGKTGRMSDWVHYALYNGYWKYLISNLGNSPKPQPAHAPSTSSSRNENGQYSPPNPPSENETPPPSPPSPAPRPLSQARTPPETPQSPRTQNSQSTPPRSRFNFDPERVWKTKRNSLQILLMTEFTTEREFKTQYRQLGRIYHPDKYDQTSTQMTPRQSD